MAGSQRVRIKLKAKESREIKELLEKGKASVRVICRAIILKQMDAGVTAPKAAEVVGMTAKTARNIAHKYNEGGLQEALYERERPGQPIRLGDRAKQEIVAMVCSSAPEGYSRWTLELIVEESQKRKIIEKTNRESIRLLLKSHDLKPWLKKMWCIGELDAEYIEKMEDVLDLYEKEYDEQEPVVCLDEKPVQLLSDIRPELPGKPGQVKKQDSEYKREGTCNVFCGVEPKGGRHFTKVTKNRKGSEFAKMVGKLERAYPRADKIHLVMDNLNTHREKSLVDYYGEEKGKKIWSRFEVHYTPKHGSWLDQAEIEIGLFSRQCLGKDRIGSIEELKKRAKAWNQSVNKKKLKINWKFTTQKARKSLKYKKTKKGKIKLLDH